MVEQSIGKLLPGHGFRLTRNGEPPKNDYIALTHLYQPLIGQIPVSLYQLLVSEYETLPVNSVQSHHTLMTYLSIPLDKIYEARKKLEAIGLMRTFCSQGNDEQTIYVYQLYPPFSPEEFFLDNMLSLLLHHELGDDKYNRLKSRLVSSSIHIDQYEEVTATFDEVFHQMTMPKEQPDRGSDVKDSYTDRSPRGPMIEYARIDFEWLHHALKQRMYPSEKILTGANRRVISQLASLYNLASHEIEKAVTWAINEENELVMDELKSACHDFLKEKASPDFSQVDKRDRVEQSSSEKPKSKEEQFISMLEQISPRELLEDLSGGNRASDQDLKLIRDVMTEQGLSPGVMNVLVHYVLLKADMKLSKPYLEKIASHWTRKNVTNVRQAMNLAKAEHQKYQQWGKQKQTYRKNKGKEVIPEWFKETNNEAKPVNTSSSVNTDDIAERIKKLTNEGK